MAEQRLVQLEVYAARLAEMKHNLRDNYEKVQQEVADVMMTETTMIKNREAQLKKELLGIFVEKEDVIMKQQEDVYKAIGACRQAINTKQHPPVALIDAAMTQIEEDVELGFEADIEGSRVQIANLGEIKCKTVENRQKVGHCLANFSENYDDQDDNMWLMYNKTCQLNAMTPDTPHEVEKVKSWLHRLPGDSDVLNFDVSKYATDVDSETTSSFEIITENRKEQQQQRAPISEKFIASLQRPMKEWLIEVSKTCSTTPEPYQFGQVIRNLQNSDDKRWIQESSQEESVCSSSATVVEMEQDETEEETTSGFDETAFIENLARMFGQTLTSVTEKKIGQDDVEAWRNLVNSMQKNRNWLHQ